MERAVEGGTATFIAKTQAGVDNVEWMPDGKRALFLSGGHISYWDKIQGR